MNILLEHELTKIIDPTFQPVTTNDVQAKARCHRMITMSITTEVTSLITDPQMFSKTPATIVNKLQVPLIERMKLDHFTLMKTALNVILEGSVEKYIQQHIKIGKQQIESSIPGIQHKGMTISYILQGLLHDHRFN